jgi:hypothetical protein
VFAGVWPITVSSDASTSVPEVGALPSTGITRLQQYYDPVRLPHRAARPSLTSRAATPRPEWASPVTRPTFPTCRAHYPADQTGACVDCFPVCAAFPVIQAGRHPHHHFRGLLRLHSRYGPLDCSTAHGGLCHEASTTPVTRLNRSSATRPIDNYLGGSFLHW